MLASVEIRFGILILVISLMYMLLGKVDPTQTATCEKHWRIHWRNDKSYCPTNRISISCTGGHILIQDAYAEIGSKRQNLSDMQMLYIINVCNSQSNCKIPRDQKCFHITFRGWNWTLYIQYQCTNNICSDSTGSTTSPGPDTSTTPTLSSERINTTSFSSSTTSQLPSSTPKTTISERTSAKQSTASGNDNMTTSLSEATTEEETNVPPSSVASTSYNTTIHTTNEPQFDLYSDTDEKSTDKVTIAICVSVTVLGLVGFILAVIFYCRWRKKKTIDYVYHSNTTTENTDTGFTNLTYSETANKDDVKYDDMQSHSADSGYTDMQVDDTLADTNDDYYSIKDGKEETLQPENDNYYAIKDNASQEYNKITFRPKSIPEDPSYVHTLCATTIKDKTYDHVDGKECIKSELHNDDYSHLNQRKDHACNNTRCSPVGEAFKEHGTAVEPYEEEDGYTPDHKYFTLETNKYSRQTEVDKENNVSHGYFVLEKESHTKTDLADGNDVINTAGTVKESDPSVSSTDHVYFENCRQVDAESDSHQYQALEQHTADPMEKSVENVNHDYFVLDKEINATETDKETDVCHTYFVLEDEIPAKNNSKDDNDFRKTHATLNATSVVQYSSTTPSSEHTYFENRMQAGTESDTHQYQKLEQHISEPNVEYQND